MVVRTRRATRADVVRAGAEITAQRGFAALTLSEVADRVGIRRPSIYHHVPGGLRDLRSAVVEAISRELARSTAGEDGPEDGTESATGDGIEDGTVGPGAVEDDLQGWQDRTLRRVGRAVREYPGVVEYLLTTGRDEQLTLTESDRLIGLLLGSTLRDRAPEAFMIVHAYVTGWATAQRSTSRAADAAGLTRLAHTLGETEHLDQELVLYDGLRALLAGLSEMGTSAGSA